MRDNALTRLLVSGQFPEFSDCPLIGLESFSLYKTLTNYKFKSDQSNNFLNRS